MTPSPKSAVPDTEELNVCGEKGKQKLQATNGMLI